MENNHTLTEIPRLTNKSSAYARTGQHSEDQSDLNFGPLSRSNSGGNINQEELNFHESSVLRLLDEEGFPRDATQRHTVSSDPNF
jgi:hypothetical protein